MLHWDAIDLLNGSGALVAAAVPATVYVKSHGIESTTAGSDGMTLSTQLKATLDPDVPITTDNLVDWKGDRYVVRAVVPVAAKGIVRFLSVELARSVG